MEYPARNYFKNHATITDYDKAFNQPREEAIGDPSEQPTFFANIYFVKKDSLRKSVCRAKKSRHRNQHGGYNTHGGNNKVLSPWQEEVIRQYCYEQWEAGNGATFSMVMSAITHLRAKMNPPLPALTKRWFASWLKKNPMLNTIHTKPISYARLELYSEESVKEWFADLYKTVGEFEIDNGKKILNMDESGARDGCPTGAAVIVLTEVKELYTASPENCKSVTIIETIRGDGKKTLPPYIIVPGKKIMENWIAFELVGDEGIDCSISGYINNDIIMKYADHLIKYSHAGRNKPWKLLLLDGHESHRYDPFVLKLAENHIKAFWFPSHLTHILQPLDVGVFRPWKHFHNLCIQTASRNLEFEYTITSFFRDLTQIRKAMKIYTIKGAFQESGMWPLTLKAGSKKMRSYGRKKWTLEESLDEEMQPDLPLLPPNRPSDLWNTTVNIQSFIGRDPTQFSDNTKEIFQKTMVDTAVNLHKAHLTTVEHATLQEKVKRETTRKKASRRSIHKGGAAANIGDLRERMKIRKETERVESLRKAKKALQIAVNKSTQALRVAGVAARKENKEKKKRVAACIARSDLPAPTDLLLLKEPDKNQTILEAASMTPEGHHEYLHAVLQAEKESNGELEAGELFIRLGNTYQREDVGVKYIESSPIRETFVESSDVESDASSIDSIRRNADFIAFDNI